MEPVITPCWFLFSTGWSRREDIDMAAVQVQVLGCGDAVGSGGRSHSCFYVKSAKTNFLIDCGASALLAMKKQKITTQDVDSIIISHFHGDHYGGLVFFLLDAVVFTGRTKPLTVVSPPGCRERLKQLIDLQYPKLPQVMERFPITFLEYSGKQHIREKGLVINTYPVLHTPESLPHAVKIQVEDKV